LAALSNLGEILGEESTGDSAFVGIGFRYGAILAAIPFQRCWGDYRCGGCFRLAVLQDLVVVLGKEAATALAFVLPGLAYDSVFATIAGRIRRAACT